MRRTSQSHPLAIAELPCGDGQLGLTFCPGKKGASVYGESWDRSLELDLDRIVAWAPDLVITLMETHEFGLLAVPGLGGKIQERGLEWRHLPIVDVATPDKAFESRWVYFGYRIRAMLRGGGRVLIHCRGGLGRTGLLAARLLVEFGTDPAKAIAQVRDVRPGTIETRGQEDYVLRQSALETDPIHAERVLGCLFGGAVGDGFGYTVEFQHLAQIRARFGPAGLTEPVFVDGKLIVSDDTQMTLFTAEGLTKALFRDPNCGPADIVQSIKLAYLDWLKTQSASFGQHHHRGLMAHRALWARRAPGTTCLSALIAGGDGTPLRPINDSKGCGGVMRVAPIGLLRRLDGDRAFDIGARAAALTHGHPSGYLSAGAMCSLVGDLIGGRTMADSIAQAIARLESWPNHSEVVVGMERAIAAAERGPTNASAAVRQLGEGWVGEEALSIGLYAAAVARSFPEALAIASNHDGDSDSTASIAGQIWGAAHGLEGVPDEWATALDVFGAVCEMAGGLMGRE